MDRPPTPRRDRGGLAAEVLRLRVPRRGGVRQAPHADEDLPDKVAAPEVLRETAADLPIQELEGCRERDGVGLVADHLDDRRQPGGEVGPVQPSRVHGFVQKALANGGDLHPPYLLAGQQVNEAAVAVLQEEEAVPLGDDPLEDDAVVTIGPLREMHDDVAQKLRELLVRLAFNKRDPSLLDDDLSAPMAAASGEIVRTTITILFAIVVALALADARVAGATIGLACRTRQLAALGEGHVVLGDLVLCVSRGA